MYYESRVIHLKLDEATLRLIDAEYDLMARNADPYVIEQSKKVLGQMEAILAEAKRKKPFPATIPLRPFPISEAGKLPQMRLLFLWRFILWLPRR